MARALANAERARNAPPPPEPPPVPRATDMHDEAVALVRAAFPVREQQTWRWYDEHGWVCRETGEVSAATLP